MSDQPLKGYFDMMAQEDANRANAEIARKNAQANYKMFKEARKYLSPKYFKKGEKALASAAKRSIGILEGQYGGLRNQLLRNREFVNRYDPVLAGADRTARGIFDRSLTNE